MYKIYKGEINTSSDNIPFLDLQMAQQNNKVSASNHEGDCCIPHSQQERQPTII
jgi:hypothetical protein